MKRVTKIKKYIEKELIRVKSNNISICMDITDREIKQLNKFYRVNRGCFGYIEFKTI